MFGVLIITFLRYNHYSYNLLFDNRSFLFYISRSSRVVVSQKQKWRQRIKEENEPNNTTSKHKKSNKLLREIVCTLFTKIPFCRAFDLIFWLICCAVLAISRSLSLSLYLSCWSVMCTPCVRAFLFTISLFFTLLRHQFYMKQLGFIQILMLMLLRWSMVCKLKWNVSLIAKTDKKSSSKEAEKE